MAAAAPMSQPAMQPDPRRGVTSSTPGARARGSLRPVPGPDPDEQAPPALVRYPYWKVLVISMIPVLGPLRWQQVVHNALRRYAREAPAAPERLQRYRFPMVLVLPAPIAALASAWFTTDPRVVQGLVVVAIVATAALVVNWLRTWGRLRALLEAEGVNGAPSSATGWLMAPMAVGVAPIPMLYQAWLLNQAEEAATAADGEPRNAENADIVAMSVVLTLLVFSATFLVVWLPPAVESLMRDDNGSCLTIHAEPAPQLRAEHVWVRNRCSGPRNLHGWSISYPGGERFGLRDTVLAPGQRLRVHTGRGTNTVEDRYLARDAMLLRGRVDGGELVRRNGSIHTDTAASANMHDVWLPRPWQQLSFFE